MAERDDLPTPEKEHGDTDRARGFWETLLGFFIDNKLIVAVLLILVITGGLMTAPFRWDVGLPSIPVSVDAIPDIGENQQIVFTPWSGRSPRDVEDQISYPLTTALLGMPGVRTVRTYSMFGFSTIYVIFEEDVEFYWSRSRVLEKLASLPSDTLPDGVSPTLGPDATALGQVFWYSLEGRNPATGEVVGGWDLDELRSIQDWTVRYALQSVPGVSETASIGGFVREYQVDVDPEAMRAHGVTIDQVAQAVRMSNLDTGARTIEINRVEYVVRSIGFLGSLEDIENTVVANREHTPIRVGDVAKVGWGPAQRRGTLDFGGAETVGGVVVSRFGANPLEVIERVKTKIDEIQPGLPRRVLEDGTVSQVTIVPFYDRTGLIYETLGTLSSALIEQILITLIVVLVMLRKLRASVLVSSMLPLGVLGAFIVMKVTGVDANLMALSGIAIAIGVMVDLAIVVSENVLEHLEAAPPGANRSAVVRRAVAEVAPAVMTSTLTTVVSFLPVFGLTAAEGKLFSPLAYTKSFAMVAALLLSLVVLPALAHGVLRKKRRPIKEFFRTRGEWARALLQPWAWLDWAFVVAGLVVAVVWSPIVGSLISLICLARIGERVLPEPWHRVPSLLVLGAAITAVTVMLSDRWLPIGAERGPWPNRLFVAAIIAAVLGGFALFIRGYARILRWLLAHKLAALSVPMVFLVFGTTAWLGFNTVFSWLPEPVRTWSPVVRVAHGMPGFGREFMPPLDEGSFLYMPTTMPHASIGEAKEQMQRMDAAIAAVPEVESAVGKLGRAGSALDPAPISMFETIVNYKSEYKLDERGRRGTFAYDDGAGEFLRDAEGSLVPDPDGRPFRQWRSHIRSADDIWDEVQKAAELPGVTSAPKLMPIAARIVMLQSGMRAPMGMKIRGPSLEVIERVALDMEATLKEVPSILPATVTADRVVGKPYLEIVIDRDRVARHGISVQQVQNVLQIAIGGATLTRTVEGRERYPVRVRYPLEARMSVESLSQVFVPSPLGHEVPLDQLSSLRYVRGPQVIKSEDTFLTAYVTFDKIKERSEVDVVEDAQSLVRARIASGELLLPDGVSYVFAGNYENQVRSEKSLTVLFPLAGLVIFLLIYLQFRRVTTTLMIFSSVFVAMSGGMTLLWLYGQPWFLDLHPFGLDLRSILQVAPINLSVAVWVGFIALIGIATDDGVILATYLKQQFERSPPRTVQDVRDRTLEAGLRRVRPCLMTTATTLLALLPVIMSTGRGADVMGPMALPAVGGMSLALVTLFVVPVLYSLGEEVRLRWAERDCSRRWGV
jgi:Cu(I)/Ag(I) efflux system membrane protein CusA/SilA